ncbi:MAG: flagellar hook-basal body complex protein FliE [Oligoflexia bacterium]|nr:flagellar hook-basal body complex protein FliE [Oligoflexia bacterium]
MDGLTIRSANQILNQGQTTKEITRQEIGAPISPSIGKVDKAADSFASSLKEAVNAVNTAQKDADRKMQELATGKSNNIHETMIAAEKADISLRLMVQVRNKVIEAYHEIMKMQV